MDINKFKALDKYALLNIINDQEETIEELMDIIDVLWEDENIDGLTKRIQKIRGKIERNL